MRLTHAALPVMVNQNNGVIVNVSSVASWIAGGAYSAAKSYSTVFSEYLNNELKGSNVKVSALCPGFTRTEFHQRGKMKMGGLPNFMWLDANKLVTRSWVDAKIINQFQYQFGNIRFYLPLRNTHQDLG
jgi:short-subunit dehydrogenase